jgi:hypothetical protein
MALAAADEVWNRACNPLGTTSLVDGDRALAAMIEVHSLAMNGGLLDAVEGLALDEVAAGVAGYRYFGLDGAAEVIEWVANRMADVDPDDFDAVEQLESEADRRYAAQVPDDSTLTRAFEAIYREHPGAFAPVG